MYGAFEENARHFSRLLQENPELNNAISPQWSDYIPHEPTYKQSAFLMLDGFKEAFYGGAAGGGKSDALLMGALQHVDNPFFAAIIFRKTFADLKLPGALIDRSLEWLSDTPAKWSPNEHAWHFPSGAVVAFGYLDTELNKFRYQSAEFQYVAFDELTQFWQDDYEYLFSRLRRTACTEHKINPETGAPLWHPNCLECLYKRSIPIRMRSASNPGGIGHIWVKDHFRIEEVDGIYRGTHPERAYIPAFIDDNPYLDQRGYKESLSHLDPVTRGQLTRGDWGISADGRFRKSWVKYYSLSGDYIILGPDRRGRAVHRKRCMVFMTVDPAASAREGPGDVQIYRHAPSYTVICTWVLTNDFHLLLWDCVRFREEIPDVVAKIGQVFKTHKDAEMQPQFIGIEAGGMQVGVYQYVSRAGYPSRPLYTRSQDKLVRATDVITRMEQGKVWLPQQSLGRPWLSMVEAELFTWTAHPQQQDDIVDNFAYAGIITSGLASNSDLEGTTRDTPTVFQN